MVNRVLFVMERYCDANPKCGPTISEHVVVGAVISTGLINQAKHFYFDVLSQKLGRDRMSEMLWQDCQVFHPDLIIYTPLGGALGEQLNPPREMVNTISDELGIKIYVHLYDAKPACGLEKSWLPFVRHLGITDSISAFLYYKENPKVILAYHTVSPRYFYDKKLKRDIDVSCLGSIDPLDGRWPMKFEYTNFLKMNSVNVFIAGGQRGANRLSVEEYSNILNRSKISLNFCRDGGGRPCLKTRVFESIACGALLFEDSGTTDTPKLFEPGRDFVIFQDQQDLLGKVRYYLAHDNERRAIAESGHEKVTRIYNPRNMWGYIFEKMGFKVPESLAQDKNYLLQRKIMEDVGA